jgi:glycolate oxidase
MKRRCTDGGEESKKLSYLRATWSAYTRSRSISRGKGIALTPPNPRRNAAETDLPAIEGAERRARVQPGVKYDAANALARSRGLTLRYDVSSGGFSTVGGNVATKAGGLSGASSTGPSMTRSCMSGSSIPATDWSTQPRALLDHADPSSIAAHLMAGSAGTLGILSAIEMNLVPVPERRALCIAFFTDLRAAVRIAPQIAALKPPSCEALDATCTALPGEIERARDTLRELIRRTSLSLRVVVDEERMEKVWEVRKSLLTRIERMREDREHRYISFVDDMAVPLPNLPAFIEALRVVMYGRICEAWVEKPRTRDSRAVLRYPPLVRRHSHGGTRRGEKPRRLPSA